MRGTFITHVFVIYGSHALANGEWPMAMIPYNSIVNTLLDLLFQHRKRPAVDYYVLYGRQRIQYEEHERQYDDVRFSGFG